MGVSASPGCSSGAWCDVINYIIENLVYFSEIQDMVGPAGYFRDPADIANFMEYSVFLPYLNNIKNITDHAKESIEALNGALLVMFSNDTVIYPKETAWFHELQADYHTILPMEETTLYKENTLGLKTLKESGRLTTLEWPGEHLQFTMEQIKDVIVPFLL
jgi:palmitoyl-protein thioesterase